MKKYYKYLKENYDLKFIFISISVAVAVYCLILNYIFSLLEGIMK